MTLLHRCGLLAFLIGLIFLVHDQSSIGLVFLTMIGGAIFLAPWEYYFHGPDS